MIKMAILKLILTVFMIAFCVSAFFGLVGFIIDLIRFPQKHEKVKIVSSAEAAEQSASEADETSEGLTLDENIEIDL